MHRSGTGAREVDLLLQVRLAAKAEVDRIPGLDVGGSPWVRSRTLSMVGLVVPISLQI